MGWLRAYRAPGPLRSGAMRLRRLKYVGILERLFLLRQVPPWSHNAVSRLTKMPKLHFLDTGLLAALRDTTASQLQKDRTGYGPLLENFVVSEVLKHITWSDKRLRVSHFRTKEQDEVDLVLEDRRGRVIGIEVKASANCKLRWATSLCKAWCCTTTTR